MKVVISNKDPLIRCYSNGNRELMELVEVVYGALKFTARADVVVDGSSIPRFFWRLLGSPTTGANLLAGILHDQMYKFQIFDRKTCDKIFYAILIELGKKKWKAWLMYRAVRMFGKSHYG